VAKALATIPTVGSVPLLRHVGLACVALCAAAIVTGCGASSDEPSTAAPKADPKLERIEREMHAWLVAASEPGLEAVRCTHSDAFEQVGAIDDFHNCIVSSTDGSAETWCVLSRGERVFDGSVPGSCEDAKAGGWGQGPFPSQPAPPTAEEARWALQAEAVCGPWAERQIEAIASLDDERLHDFSYVWRVMRPINAGIVEDLSAIPNPRGRAERALELYRRRLALIDEGIREFDRGREKKGIALFDRVERGKLLLSKVFAEIRADTCSPA
jgi:hypothetical protein